MKRFFVEFLVDTPISIGTRVEQQTKVPGHAYKMVLRNAEIVVFDALSQLPGSSVRISKGLGIHMYLDSPNPEDAVRVGKEIAEVIITYLSFASCSSCPSARPRRLYDATPGESSRVYRQWFAYDVPGTIQQADQKIAGAVLRAIDASGNPASVRALALLRKGLSEENYYDQFSAYWMALEALNNDLKVRLPKLRLYKEGSFDKGIMRFFVRHLHWRYRNYVGVKHTRNGLFHCTEHHTRHFTKRIAGYVPLLRGAASQALGLVLDLPRSVTRALNTQKACIYRPFRGFCEVLIELDGIPSLAEFGRQPFLKFQKPHLQLGINEDGTLQVGLKQAIGKTELHNGKRCDSNYKFAIDHGPRRKNLKGIHTRGDGTEEVLTIPD